LRVKSAPAASLPPATATRSCHTLFAIAALPARRCHALPLRRCCATVAAALSVAAAVCQLPITFLRPSVTPSGSPRRSYGERWRLCFTAVCPVLFAHIRPSSMVGGRACQRHAFASVYARYLPRVAQPYSSYTVSAHMRPFSTLANQRSIRQLLEV